MKTKLSAIIAFLLCTIPAWADSNTVPELPATDPSTWTDGTVFWAGVTLGFTWGGVAFIYRIVRQIGKQNPEI